MIVFLRNRLKYALTYDEVKKILKQRLIKVDGKVRTDVTYPAGFMGKRFVCTFNPYKITIITQSFLSPQRRSQIFKANKMCFTEFCTEFCTEFYAAYLTWLLLGHNFDMSIAAIRPKAQARALAGILVL